MSTNRSATLAMIETIEYAVVSAPWRALSVLAWGWAIYQIVRILSLLQDMVYEHIRVVGREWVESVNDIMNAVISGVAAGLTIVAAVAIVAAVVCVAHLIGLSVQWGWQWWGSHKP